MEAFEHRTGMDTTEPVIETKRPASELHDEPESHIRWWTLLKYLAISVVVIFLLLVLLDKVVMPWYVKLGAVETVPNVVGIPFAEAQKRLAKLGFEVKKGEPRFDDRYAAGTVVMQLPYGGSQTKQGRRIYLTLSRGTELIPMPDLTGMLLREARINLMRNGFDIGEISYDHNDTIMKDLVFAQSIPSTVPTRPGALVNVMISRGPSTRFTMMPNLLSLDIDQARSRLENAGLVLGVVRYKEDPTFVKNTVIEQGVVPYAQVAQGAAVDVTISGTPDPESAVIGDEGGSPEPEVKNIAPPANPPRRSVPHPNAPRSDKSAPSKPASKPSSSKPASLKPTSKPSSSKSPSKPVSKPATSKPSSSKPATSKPSSKPAATKPSASKPSNPK